MPDLTPRQVIYQALQPSLADANYPTGHVLDALGEAGYVIVARGDNDNFGQEEEVEIVIVDPDDPAVIERVVHAILYHTNHNGIQCGEGSGGRAPTPLSNVARVVLAALKDGGR